MDLAWLEVFQEVAARGSVTGAAQALGYTQPAVSRQISALEKATGAHLFDRLPRGVRLTEEGHRLLAHVKVVLARMQSARDELEALRALDAGRLRVGAFDSANAALVPEALAALRAAHPNIRLSVLERPTTRLLDRLRDGEIDVAVISAYAHQSLATADLHLHHLLDDPLLVALPTSHPLAGPDEPLPLADLAAETWIEGFAGNTQTLIDACQRAGFRPRIEFTAHEWIAKQGFVAAGLGLALVPLLAAGTVRPGIVLRRLRPQDTPVRRVHAATWRAVATPAPVTTFLGHLHVVAGQWPVRGASVASRMS